MIYDDLAHETVHSQYCSLVTDCRVQCVIKARNPELLHQFMSFAEQNLSTPLPVTHTTITPWVQVAIRKYDVGGREDV